LRAEKHLNRDVYEFFWPGPNESFLVESMRYGWRETESEGRENVSSKMVALTLFPGIRAYDATHSAARGTGISAALQALDLNAVEERGENVAVLAKAFVLVK
jgi:hypothetical protein